MFPGILPDSIANPRDFIFVILGSNQGSSGSAPVGKTTDGMILRESFRRLIYGLGDRLRWSVETPPGVGEADL